MTRSTSSPSERGNQLAHVLDNLVEIDNARLQHLHAAEGEKLARERSGAIGGAIDELDFACGCVAMRESVRAEVRCGP